MTDESLKKQVGRFYNEVGWHADGDGLYQNALYEDLRPVSAEYIARAHARVSRHLAPSGEFLLDAGSGPVQYKAYLAYSAGYERRVCFDISFVALQEARKRLGEHGFYVVGDIAHLPFKPDAFDGIVSLHTIHHLPMEEKVGCYQGLYACLKPGRSMVTVDGWAEHKLSRLWRFMIRVAEKLRPLAPVEPTENAESKAAEETKAAPAPVKSGPAGTFVVKNNAAWFKRALGGVLPFRIYPWRSVSTHFLRTVIQPQWGGKLWLRLLYRLEESFPRYFGENGQYPLIVISKPAETDSDN